MTERTRRTIETLAVFLLALAYLLHFHPFQRPVVLDPATWDYMSLALRDGVLPYRDIFLHKTPGAMFFGAAGAGVARALGYDPLLGAHAVFICFGAAAAPMLFYACRLAGCERAPALAAAAWMLAYDQWSLGAIEGARPKIATTTLGLAALLAASARPFLSGVLGGACTLCWQPGIVFLAGAALCRIRRPEGERPSLASSASALTPLAMGAALPVLALGLFLWWHGALDEFWQDAVLFNVHYVEINARTPLDTLVRVFVLLRRWNVLELVLLVPALVGLGMGRTHFPPGLATATLLYAALLFVSVQAWPDTILLAPGMAAALAIGLSLLLRRSLGASAAMAVLALAIYAMATPRSERFSPPISLAEQRRQFQELAADLSPTDHVLAVSAPELLIHTGRRSVLPWPYMWFGVDRYAADATDGGFDGLLARIEAADPKLMVVCRRWNGPLRRRFDAWAAERYTRESVRIYPHVVRPMAVYRRRT